MATTIIITLAILIILIVAFFKRKSFNLIIQDYRDRRLQKWCIKQVTRINSPDEDLNRGCLAETFFLLTKKKITYYEELPPKKEEEST